MHAHAFRSIAASALLTGLLGAAPGAAQTAGETCDIDYVIKRGDTLSGIARRAYGNQNEWSRLFYANQRTLGKNPSAIFADQVIRIPCKAGEALRAEVEAENDAAQSAESATATEDATETATESAAAAPAPAPEPEPETVETAAVAAPSPSIAPRKAKPLSILTAGDYAPYTDRSLPKGGMLNNVVEAALLRANIEHKITWINDWAAHLDPLIKEKTFDMGFPWFRPPCGELEDDFRCNTFLFTDPLFEMLITLFVRSDSQLTYSRDDDIVGKTLCRPSGWFTFDLNADGRNWLKEDKIILMQPQQVSECFDLLLEGKVDAVAMNEFTGRQTISQMELQGKVRWLDRPLGVQPLHMLIAKTHPKATVYLYRVNNALRELQESGEYDEIIGEHLELFWRDIG